MQNLGPKEEKSSSFNCGNDTAEFCCRHKEKLYMAIQQTHFRKSKDCDKDVCSFFACLFYLSA